MNNNEYIVQPNEKGGYDLILGGVGLSGQECVDLINELKESEIILQDAEVTLYINGSNNMPQINEHAQRFTSEILANNYEMAHDPYAEVGNKPFESEPVPEPESEPEEEHHKTR